MVAPAPSDYAYRIFLPKRPSCTTRRWLESIWENIHFICTARAARAHRRFGKSDAQASVRILRDSQNLHCGNGSVCGIASCGTYASGVGHTVKLISPQFVKPFVKSTNRSPRRSAREANRSKPSMPRNRPLQVHAQRARWDRDLANAGGSPA